MVAIEMYLVYLVHWMCVCRGLSVGADSTNILCAVLGAVMVDGTTIIDDNVYIQEFSVTHKNMGNNMISFASINLK